MKDWDFVIGNILDRSFSTATLKALWVVSSDSGLFSPRLHFLSLERKLSLSPLAKLRILVVISQGRSNVFTSEFYSFILEALLLLACLCQATIKISESQP